MAIGNSAGAYTQGAFAVAIGQNAGLIKQNTSAIAIGFGAGQTNQGIASIAIGLNAGQGIQGTNAIAIGLGAGFTNQGTNAIAIGQYAGQTNQPANSIIVNATSLALASATFANASYIAPIRSDGTATTLSLLLYNSTTSEVMVSTDTTAAGSKTFVIDHPNDADRYLVHSCLEGPEAGVYYRGQGRIENGVSSVVLLPAYVDNLAYNFSVQLTPLFDENGDYPNLQSSAVADNQFTVYGDNCDFYWIVHGSRMDIEVEPLKANTIVKGDGPYKWIPPLPKVEPNPLIHF